MTDIEDITDSDLAHAPGPEDRVFRLTADDTSGSYVVKVKTWEDPAAPLGRQTLWLSASLCDDDGRALLTASGDPAVHPARHQHVIDGHRDTGQGGPDVVAHIDAIQRQVAETVLNAIRNQAAARSARGVGVVPRSLT